jgi:hypothetical protein
MTIKLIDHLNGWQRIYAVIVVVGAVVAYNTVPKYEIDWTSVSLNPYLPKIEERQCLEKDPADCNPFSRFVLGKDTKDFVVDGVKLNEDNRYTQEQVEKAFRAAKVEYTAQRREVIFESYKTVYLNYFGLMALLYVLGWSFAWIRRGFKS